MLLDQLYFGVHGVWVILEENGRAKGEKLNYSWKEELWELKGSEMSFCEQYIWFNVISFCVYVCR